MGQVARRRFTLARSVFVAELHAAFESQYGVLAFPRPPAKGKGKGKGKDKAAEEAWARYRLDLEEWKATTEEASLALLFSKPGRVREIVSAAEAVLDREEEPQLPLIAFICFVVSHLLAPLSFVHTFAPRPTLPPCTLFVAYAYPSIGGGGRALGLSSRARATPTCCTARCLRFFAIPTRMPPPPGRARGKLQKKRTTAESTHLDPARRLLGWSRCSRRNV